MMERIGTLIATKPKRILGLTGLVTLLAIVARPSLRFRRSMERPTR